MTTVTIKTNHHPRATINSWELTESERKQFDYYNADELDSAWFVRYKGHTYDLGEFTRLAQTDDSMFPGWHGIAPDSFFSGIVVRWDQDYDEVVLGTYFA